MTQAQIDSIKAVIVELNNQIIALQALLPAEENPRGTYED
jgi:hypothetical protein